MAAESAVSNNNVDKRYAVVTGANKGIGFGICEQLAAKGIVVILTARDEKRGIDAVEKLKKASGFSSENVLFHKLDVSDSSSIASLVQFINSQFGKLDILVNNAGIAGFHLNIDVSKDSEVYAPGEIPNFLKNVIQDLESATECIQTNYYGTKKMIETFFPLLHKSKSPRIVNVSSSVGQLENVGDGKIKEVIADADNLTEEKIDEVINEFLKDVKDDTLKAKGWSFWSAYIMSKAAMNAYTRIVARRYPNMKINAVCPGYVKTDITYNTGILTVEEGAAGPVKLALLPDDGPSGLFFVRGEVSSF